MKPLFFMICRQWLSAATFLCLFFLWSSVYLPSISFAAGTLTVTISGDGTVNNSSLPSGLIVCPGDCSETFSSSDIITLSASASANSLFTGWSGACTGTDDCTLTMTSSWDVTATFSPNYCVGIAAHNVVPVYATITDAYTATDSNSAYIVQDQSSIWATVDTITEDVTLNRGISIYLNGGTDGGLPTNGYTTLDGTLNASVGSVNISHFIVNDLVASGGSIVIDSLIIQ